MYLWDKRIIFDSVRRKWKIHTLIWKRFLPYTKRFYPLYDICMLKARFWESWIFVEAFNWGKTFFHLKVCNFNFHLNHLYIAVAWYCERKCWKLQLTTVVTFQTWLFVFDLLRFWCSSSDYRKWWQFKRQFNSTMDDCVSFCCGFRYCCIDGIYNHSSSQTGQTNLSSSNYWLKDWKNNTRNSLRRFGCTNLIQRLRTSSYLLLERHMSSIGKVFFFNRRLSYLSSETIKIKRVEWLFTKCGDFFVFNPSKFMFTRSKCMFLFLVQCYILHLLW